MMTCLRIIAFALPYRLYSEMLQNALLCVHRVWHFSCTYTGCGAVAHSAVTDFIFDDVVSSLAQRLRFP